MTKKLVGILAGMGPRSTAPFVDAIVSQCQRIYDAKLDEEFPRMMILSLPTPFYVDRPIDHDRMKAAIIDGLRQLESIGVDFIAMPCNAAHIYFDELRCSITVPLLNIVDETLASLKDLGRTTLLGTRGTLESNLYQDGFHRAGLEFVFDQGWQDLIDQTISLIKSGDSQSGGASTWNELLSHLVDAEVQQAVIACTDLNVVLDPKAYCLQFVDSSDCLAAATVNRYLARSY